MLPRETLASAAIPGSDERLHLVSHGRDFIIMLGRDELMSSRMQFSEEQLAELTLDRVSNEHPRVLIGGYGMGFTLRAALSKTTSKAQIVVAEIVPEIIEWARGEMSAFTGASLEDPRVRIELHDVAALIDDASDGTAEAYDAILLDVDNGPDGMVREANARLYSPTGLGRARDALVTGGVLAVWSAAEDHKFTRKLKDAGFSVEQLTVRARPNNKGPRHHLWFARKG